MAGFSSASSSASAALSPGRSIGSGPRRSPIRVMGLLCRGARKLDRDRRHELDKTPRPSTVTGGQLAGCRTHQGPTREMNRLTEPRSTHRPPRTADRASRSEPATEAAPAVSDETPPFAEEHPTEVMSVEPTRPRASGSTAERTGAAAVHRTVRDSTRRRRRSRPLPNPPPRCHRCRTHRQRAAAAATTEPTIRPPPQVIPAARRAPRPPAGAAAGVGWWH